MNSEKQPDPSKETMDQLDDLNFHFLDLFDQLESKDAEKFEDEYAYNVGSFCKLLRRLLDEYHDETRNKEDQSRIKPFLLYYRELQQYFIYFVRFPSAIYQKNHPYLKDLRALIENKEKMIKIKYKPMAVQQSMLFETDFREKLEKTLSRR